jgi:hypothetical protein
LAEVLAKYRSRRHVRASKVLGAIGRRNEQEDREDDEQHALGGLHRRQIAARSRSAVTAIDIFISLI